MKIGISIGMNDQPISATGETYAFPMDAHTGVQTGFSLAFKLREAYTGNAILIRNEDSVELDVGYIENVVDLTAVENHRTGTGKLSLIRAYDNSVNGYDWVAQDNLASKAPKVADASGLILDENGRLMAKRTATAHRLVCVKDSSGGVSNATIYAIIRTNSTSNVINGSLRDAYCGLSSSGSSGLSYKTSGTPSTYVNGSVVGTTQGDLHTAINDERVLVSFTYVDLSSSSSWINYNTRHVDGRSAKMSDFIQEYYVYNIDKSATRVAFDTLVMANHSIN